MLKNRALEKIRAGQPAFGLSMSMGESVVAEWFARSGFDFIWIDEQHGTFNRDSLLRTIQVIGPTDTVPIVRVGSNEFFRIGRALDAGAMGIIVPMVNSAEEAEAAVHAANYPPRGGRSRGGARLGLFAEDYSDHANESILVAVMVETKQAVDRVAEIARVDGVDVIFIGPGDLSLSLGCEMGSKEHEAAIIEVLEQARDAGTASGIACPTPEEALRRADQGFKLVHAGSEYGMIMSGIEHARETLGIEG